MKTEELIQEPANDEMHFDAHEFDGLRALDREAQSLFAKGDQFIRQNPWLCIGLAVAAGISIGYATSRK